LARTLRDVQFVLIGPEQSDLSPIRGLSNIHILGGKSHAQIPSYLQGLDIGLIPYRITEYTRNVYPTKLNEYFAMGLPVVATPLPEVEAYNNRFGGIVEVAACVEDFARSIADGLRLGSSRAAERIEAARVNGWTNRVLTMQELIAAKLRQAQPRVPVWGEAARRLAKTGWKPAIATILLLAVTMAVVRTTPLVWWLAEPLRMPGSDAIADAIVVLAGGVGESGEAGQGYEERVAHAIELYREGRAPRMVFSSGITRTFRETEVMLLLAVSHGIPTEAVIQEKQGGGIRQSTITLGSLARQEGWRSVLIVTSPYNMKRALKTWEATNPSIQALPTPPSQSDFYGYQDGTAAWSHGASLMQARAVLDEWIKIVYYKLKGWI
jgi:uncharacterized SAM-binding protein YcdF (DUF218 family)